MSAEDACPKVAKHWRHRALATSLGDARAVVQADMHPNCSLLAVAPPAYAMRDSVDAVLQILVSGDAAGLAVRRTFGCASYTPLCIRVLSPNAVLALVECWTTGAAGGACRVLVGQIWTEAASGVYSVAHEDVNVDVAPPELDPEAAYGTIEQGMLGRERIDQAWGATAAAWLDGVKARYCACQSTEESKRVSCDVDASTDVSLVIRHPDFGARQTYPMQIVQGGHAFAERYAVMFPSSARFPAATLLTHYEVLHARRLAPGLCLVLFFITDHDSVTGRFHVAETNVVRKDLGGQWRRCHDMVQALRFLGRSPGSCGGAAAKSFL